MTASKVQKARFTINYVKNPQQRDNKTQHIFFHVLAEQIMGKINRNTISNQSKSVTKNENFKSYKRFKLHKEVKIDLLCLHINISIHAYIWRNMKK